MKRIAVIIIVAGLICFMESCDYLNSKTLSTTSMEGTLKQGQLIQVTPANEIKRNDIVAFYYNENSGTEEWVFRVVGISGDKIEINSSELFVNNEFVTPPAGLKFRYRVMMDQDMALDLTEEFEGDRVTEREYLLLLTNDEKMNIMEHHPAAQVERMMNSEGHHDTRLFVMNEQNAWNVDHYGPLVVPHGENEKLYFVLGDNRHNARDSRYIGFVKESDIIGVVQND